MIDVAGRLGYDGIELRFLESDDALWARPELRASGLRETRARLRRRGPPRALRGQPLVLPSPRRGGAAGGGGRGEPGRRGRRRPGRSRHPRLRRPRPAGGRPRLDRGPSSSTPSPSCATGRGPAGVEIWLETHGDFAPGARRRGGCSTACGEGVGAIWDPANAFSEFGEAPEDGARALGSAIRHVHLKDVRRPSPPAFPVDARSARRRRVPGASGSWPSCDRRATRAGSPSNGRSAGIPRSPSPRSRLPHFVGWASAGVCATSRHRPPLRDPSFVAAWPLRSFPDGRRWAGPPPRSSSEHIRRLVARDGHAAGDLRVGAVAERVPGGPARRFRASRGRRVRRSISTSSWGWAPTIPRPSAAS